MDDLVGLEEFEGGRDDLVMRGRFGDCILEADFTRLVSVFNSISYLASNISLWPN